jgi:cell division septation protein DedD
MADEGLHEIQLNGKQLVFLFMASTVVAVVIFLCGVMVGRGVRAERLPDALDASANLQTDPTISTSAATPSAAAVTGTVGSSPVASNEILTYPDRLEERESVEEKLKAPTERPPATPVAKPVVADVPPAKDLAREPAGNGFVVQVAAVNDRREAETIARRLAGRGYPSFVTTPRSGSPRMFRVRIGKYSSRREAETIAARLEKEDQFKPWITR